MVKVYSKLQYAVHDSSPTDRIFAYDINRNGCKRFLKGSRHEFWEMYTNMKHKHRNLYEVIRNNAWCFLYFDLECKYSLNSTKQKEKVVKAFSACLHTVFAVSKLDIQILDSSNDIKYSQHWIIKNIVFTSNVEIKHVVLNIIAHIMQTSNTKLQIIDKNGTKTIIDDAVYTNNRMMRLVCSYKWGDFRPLKYCMQNGTNVGINKLTEQQFYRTLISIVEPKGLRKSTKHYTTWVYINGKLEILNKTHLNLKQQQIQKPSHVNSTCIMKTKTNNIHKQCLSTNVSSSLNIIFSKPQYKTMCDTIKMDLCTLWNNEKTGHIYNITFDDKTKQIKFYMVNNRYCKILKDKHKSNNIYFIFNIDTLCLFQHCFDPVCCKQKPVFVVKYSNAYLFNSSSASM